jgi:hypothetical protein
MTQQAQPPPAGAVIGRSACRRPLARRVLASHWGGCLLRHALRARYAVWTRGRYARKRRWRGRRAQAAPARARAGIDSRDDSNKWGELQTLSIGCWPLAVGGNSARGAAPWLP